MMLRKKRGILLFCVSALVFSLFPSGTACAGGRTGQALLPGDSFYGVWGASANNVFVVGNDGAILNYDGNRWKSMSSTAANYFSGVWGSSGSDVFAVGSDGVIVHFNGSAWRSMASGTANDLSGVWGSSGSDVFAVGRGGVVLHYDGRAWTAMNPGTTSFLASVWGASGDDVFAVGMNGTVLHYDGSNWRAVPSGVTEHLSGVWGASGDDVFAVGMNGTVLHYDGSNWRAMSSGATNHLLGVWGGSGSDVFAVGASGAVLHYNGSVWTAMPTGTTQHLHGVRGVSGNDVFAAGDGVILHYDGNAWTAVASGVKVGIASVSQANLYIGVGVFFIAPDGADFQISFRPGQSHWQIGYKFTRWTEDFATTESTETKTGPFLNYLFKIEGSGTPYLGVSVLRWSRTERLPATGESSSDSTTDLYFGGGYTGRLGSFLYYNAGLFLGPGAKLSTRTSVSSEEDEGGFDIQLHLGIAF